MFVIEESVSSDGFTKSRPGRECADGVVTLEVKVGDLSFCSELPSALTLRFL